MNTHNCFTDMYRYGFNGKESNPEINNGNQDFGARFYDGRIGRWWSVDPSASRYPSKSPYNGLDNNPIIFVDPDGRDNIIFLVVLDGVSKGEAALIVARANELLEDDLDLRTRVVLVQQSEYKTLKDKDANDLVAVLGQDRAQVKDFVKNFVPDLDNRSILDSWNGNEENFPEKSENEGDGGEGDLINISLKGASAFADDMYTDKIDAVTFLLLHGAGHNASLNHDIPESDLMNNGELLRMITQAGNGKSHYTNNQGIQSEFDESFIKEYGSVGNLSDKKL